MVEPRLGPEGALTTASTFWRFVDGRSGSEWGIVPCGSRSLPRNGSWRCLALAVLAVVIFALIDGCCLKFSAASSEKVQAAPPKKIKPHLAVTHLRRPSVADSPTPDFLPPFYSMTRSR